MRTSSRRMLSMLVALVLFFGVLFSTLLSNDAFAVAPPRPNQPYAESRCNTDPNIIFCEDFDYPQNIICTPGAFSGSAFFTWINPGLTSAPGNWGNGGGGIYCQSASIEATSNFAAQPAGSPTGGFLKKSNVAQDVGASSYVACIWGTCNTSIDATGNYANGSPPTKDLYFRLQLYQSADFTWPPVTGDKILFLYPDKFTSRTEANFDDGLSFGAGTFCRNSGLNFPDAINVMTSGGPNYFQFPTRGEPDRFGHQEYCTGQGFGNNSGNVTTSWPPNDTPAPGRLFRFNKGTWYTVEMRFKLSDPGVANGTVELWINGTKIYSASDLTLCQNRSGEGSCAAVSQLFLSSWLNPFSDVGVGGCCTGYTLVDNFIISKAYIGPPGGGTPPSPPPTPPSSPSGLIVR